MCGDCTDHSERCTASKIAMIQNVLVRLPSLVSEVNVPGSSDQTRYPLVYKKLWNITN